MDLKKLALAGAIVLIVIGCVLAAGCTSTEQKTSDDPITGFWKCTSVDIGNGVIVDMIGEFEADGIGYCTLIRDGILYQQETVKWKNLGNSTYQFDITIPDEGTYSITYSLSADKKSISDKSGRIWNKYPELLPLEKNDKIIGTWGTTSVKDGQKVDNIFIFHDDGTGYWMKIVDTSDLSFTRMREQTILKIGDNSYIAQCSAGRIYEIEYKPETDSFVVDNKSEFKRLDPIVGIWTGNSNKGGNVVTTIMKKDGTGLTTTAFADGTSQVFKLTWKKNDKGSYDIVFCDGDTATYTLGSDKKSITTSTGLSKTKQFTDSYFMLPIIGSWINENGNVLIINGDKTGTFKINNQVLPFTWDYKWNQTDKIDFTITYKSGTATDGTNLAGKTFNWTYNLNSNKLINSAGTEYSHPEKTVEGKITLN